MGTGGALSPGIKRQVCEAEHSPPSIVDVKNGGAIPPLPICLYGIALNLLTIETTLPFFFFTTEFKMNKLPANKK
jgi:hypothetical protein